MSGGERRRVVSVGAVRGVLVHRGGCWVVGNDSEVRLLEALRGERGVRDRLGALAEVLNEGLVEVKDLRRLNGRLSVITRTEPEELWRVRVPGDLMAAVAYVCVCVDEDVLSRWLEFGLSARLDANLVRGLLPGPGWLSWYVSQRVRYQTFDRDVFWISELPESFWSRLKAHRDERLKAVAVASDVSSSPAVLERLADEHHGVRAVLDVVASNPRTPTRVLLGSAFRPLSQVRLNLRVAQNRNASVALLGKLAGKHAWEPRYVTAAHPKVPVRVLRRLAGDGSDLVRAGVAGAVATPAAVLERLALDSDVWVRSNVASNPSTPPAVLEALLGDRLAAVRAAAVRNPNTPTHLLAALVGDRAVTVRGTVAAREVTAEALVVLGRDPKWRVRQAVGYNLHTPAEVLDRLAGDCCEEVRAAVAYNTSTPPAALKALAGDESQWTRECVAVNKSTPACVLMGLAQDDDPDVRGEAAENPSMPPARLKRLAVDDDWQVRAGAALNTNIPEDLLGALGKDHDSNVRRCVCHNDAVPLSVVDALRSDRDYWVRAAATAAHQQHRDQRVDTVASTQPGAAQ